MMIHFLNEDRPTHRRCQLAELLLELRPGLRGSRLHSAVSFRPDASLDGSFVVGPLRAAFAEPWETRFGEAVPTKELRLALEPPVPIGTVLEFNKLVLARDYVELEHHVAEILDMLRGRAASFQVCIQRPLFDVGRPQKAASEKKLIRAESVSSLAELVMRGPCPGLGAVLTAFGIELGVFVAFDLAKHVKESEDPWPVVDSMFKSPQKFLSAPAAKQIGNEHQQVWKSLPADRRSLLKLLSRFEITPEQAEVLYVAEERKAAGIEISDRDIVANPYRIFEITRRTPKPIGIMTVDRGVFPDPVIRDKNPLPEPSVLDTATDIRRLRAWTVQTLEAAALNGDTLVPRDDVITTIRDLKIRPALAILGGRAAT
jgi:hypothetical protein